MAIGQEQVGKMPHLTVDATQKQIRVECEALAVDMPLEFFCCVTGSNEHESVLRSDVRPSDLHAAMLMLGLTPGEPVHYIESEKKLIAPKGPEVEISVEYQKQGKTIRCPAKDWMVDLKTKKLHPTFKWVFVGSRTMPDGRYAADITGYLVSIVNFELTVIDVAEVASSSNETLEWERNIELVPPKGTKVTMIIEPAKSPATSPAH